MLPNMRSEKIVPVVLIVEDEALVRLSAVGMLEDAGFRTIEAANGDQALELLVADSNVQLLFTDVNMPGIIDGLVLARQVHDRWPHILSWLLPQRRNRNSGNYQSALGLSGSHIMSIWSSGTPAN
jgi:CheY-like chemotaxis protein